MTRIGMKKEKTKHIDCSGDYDISSEPLKFDMPKICGLCQKNECQTIYADSVFEYIHGFSIWTCFPCAIKQIKKRIRLLNKEVKNLQKKARETPPKIYQKV